MSWIERKYMRFYNILTPSKVRVFGAIMLLLSAWFIWKSMLIAGIAIGAIQLIGMLLLPVLRTEYAVFSMITYPIGKVVGFVAMGIIYFLVITPIGLIRKKSFPAGWVESTSEFSPDKMHE